MSSRELLELAAKAAGYRLDGVFGRGLLVVMNVGQPDQCAFPFDPLNDDGDSRRLQAALRISLEFGELPFQGRYARAKVTVPCTDGSGHVWEHGAIEYELTPNDMERAARYAVLHVAAAIGKEMP